LLPVVLDAAEALARAESGDTTPPAA
jgi:hypothetical protein